VARLQYTVDSLVAEVREQLDETNTSSVSDTKILNALNRGNDYVWDIYARRYPEPLLREDTLELESGTTEYDLPEDIFEDRLLKVEISTTNQPTEVDIISFSDAGKWRSTSPTPAPNKCYLRGRKLVFCQPPTGTYDALLYVLRDAEQLVLPQGRITTVSVADDYIIVDELGDSLTTSSDQLGSYVNLVDGNTGLIKCTLQISAINTTTRRVTFRSSPIRSTVLGRTVVGEIPTTVEQDDYICSILGTCVPYFARPTSNFLVEFATESITRGLQGAAAEQAEVLKRFEDQIKSAHSRRPGTLRIKQKNRAWSSRRIIIRGDS
jgi:hypothetical protein